MELVLCEDIKTPTSTDTSIAYRKQLPLQRTVGTIGKRAPLGRKLLGQPAQTRHKAKRYENQLSKMPNGARAAFA